MMSPPLPFAVEVQRDRRVRRDVREPFHARSGVDKDVLVLPDVPDRVGLRRAILAGRGQPDDLLVGKPLPDPLTERRTRIGKNAVAHRPQVSTAAGSEPAYLADLDQDRHRIGRTELLGAATDADHRVLVLGKVGGQFVGERGGRPGAVPCRSAR